MIEFSDVTKSFGEKRVLAGVSFEVKPGEIVFILGKSGQGKSVILKNIVGLMRPDSGKVAIDGEIVNELPESGLSEVRRRCGMVFQFPALLDSLTVLENVVFGARVHRRVGSDADERELASKTLRLVGLSEEIFDQLPPALSFGVQKRVAVARALAVDPEYLLYDEPTTGLDPIATWGVNSLIQKLSRETGMAALVVSHDIASALRIADRILVLDGGRIACAGTPAEVRASTHPLVKDFVKDSEGVRLA